MILELYNNQNIEEKTNFELIIQCNLGNSYLYNSKFSKFWTNKISPHITITLKDFDNSKF